MRNIELLKFFIGLLFVITAVITDFKYKKIFNKHTLPLCIIGVILNYNNLISSVSGGVAGFLIMYVFWMMGKIGGGDVKLMAGIGFLFGLRYVLFCILFSFGWGFIWALGVMIIRKNFLGRLKSLYESFLTKTVSKKKVENQEETNLCIYSPPIMLGYVTAFFYIFFYWLAV